MRLIYVYFLFLFSCNVENTTNSNKTEEGDTLKEVTCKIEEKNNPDGTDSIIVKTCNWRQYKFIKIGTPDYKGRYSYEYRAFKLNGEYYISIANNEIFNNKVADLERKINILISQEIEKYKGELDKECLKNFEQPNFTVDNMGITFEENNKITFSVSFRLGGACMNVDGTTVELSMSEIQEYLR